MIHDLDPKTRPDQYFIYRALRFDSSRMKIEEGERERKSARLSSVFAASAVDTGDRFSRSTYVMFCWIYAHVFRYIYELVPVSKENY